ncbi:MAG TPA: redoxin family protein [Candidatus Angelobacter sp.]|nr:redoxin family protein [Candidatus Angelobacter sp.]
MCSVLRYPLLVAAFSLYALTQTASQGNQRPDAATLLHQVGEKYAQAKYYHVEAVEESEYKGELFRQWEKTYTVAAMAPGNHYHFETREQMGWITRISDGKTEWIYQSMMKQYMKRPAESSGPAKPKGVMSIWQGIAFRAQNTVEGLSKAVDVLDPVYLPDASLKRNHEDVSCYVVQGKAKPPRNGRPVDSHVTFWIDKRSLAILKQQVHSEGALMMNDLNQHMVEDHITEYSVAELTASAVPDSLFQFEPPAEATLVEEFSDPLDGPATTLVGKAAPVANLKSADGKTVSLASFQGKPVLLDFWATWCAPCVKSFPDLEKLFHDTTDKGLVLLSIDEDEDAKPATDFWAKHGFSWPDFHDSNGELSRQFLQSGIPQYVLIDASGKVVFVAGGAGPERLRAAIAKLGPQFASLSETKSPSQ